MWCVSVNFKKYSDMVFLLEGSGKGLEWLMGVNPERPSRLTFLLMEGIRNVRQG
jgi:hypothetical protein